MKKKELGLFYEGAKSFTHFSGHPLSFPLSFSLSLARCASQMSKMWSLTLHEYHIWGEGEMENETRRIQNVLYVRRRERVRRLTQQSAQWVSKTQNTSPPAPLPTPTQHLTQQSAQWVSKTQNTNIIPVLQKANHLVTMPRWLTRRHPSSPQTSPSAPPGA